MRPPRAQLRRAEAFVHGSKRDRSAPFLSSVRIEFHCRRGDIEAAAAIARTRHLSPDDTLGHDTELEMLAFGRYLIAAGEHAPASRLLARLVLLSRDAGRVQVEIRALVLRALACEALGSRASALESLGQATNWLSPAGLSGRSPSR